MEFKIDSVLPATATQLWTIFFDVHRIATLIPGCEDVKEVRLFEEYTAVMKQKIGPFKFEVPTQIHVEKHTPEKSVLLKATGRDKFTGTALDIRLDVELESQGASCRLGLTADMTLSGKLASLGFGVVKKKSDELFTEFEARLKTELERLNEDQAAAATDLGQPSALVAGEPQSSATLEGDSKKEPGTPFNWRRAAWGAAGGVLVGLLSFAMDGTPWWWLAVPVLGLGVGLWRGEV